jgi:hypothetical protein
LTAVIAIGLMMVLFFQNCAPTTFTYTEEDSKSDPRNAESLRVSVDQPAACSSDNKLEFELTFKKGRPYYCIDSTNQAEAVGQICSEGPTISDFTASAESVICEQLIVCGQEPTSVDIVNDGAEAMTLKYSFKNLPLGCEGSLTANELASGGQSAEPPQVVSFKISGGSCSTCEYSGVTGCGPCLNTAENCTAPNKVFVDGSCIDKPDLGADVGVLSKTIYDEGETVFISVNGQGIPDGTELSFKVSGTGINKNGRDFVNNGSGKFLIANKVGRFSLSIINDFITEVNEEAVVEIFNAGGTIITKKFTIKDTSQSPATQITGIEQLSEGQAGELIIGTSQLPPGTVLSYRFEGKGLNSGSTDLKNSAKGSIKINSDSTSFMVTANEDLFTEGDESFNFILFNAGGILAQKAIAIEDTSLTPKVSISGATEIQEGKSEEYEVQVEGVPPGMSLMYSVSGTGINQGSLDFEASGKGTLPIENNKITVPLAATSDFRTESDEVAILKIAYSGRVLAEKNIIVRDTSRSVTLAFEGPSEMDEGSEVEVLVSADGVPDGTVFTYKVSGTGVNSGGSDFDMDGKGDLLFVDGQASLFLLAIEDKKTEGLESVNLEVASFGGKLGQKVIKLNDTSVVTPGEITGPSSADEGEPLDFEFSAPDAEDGSSVSWKIAALTGSTLSGDFKATSGSIKVMGGAGAFSTIVLEDLRTEGDELFEITLSSSKGVIAKHQLQIYDTSTLPTGTLSAPAEMSEGSSYSVTFDSTSVPEGTKVTYKIAGVGINSGSPDFIGNGAGTFLMTGSSQSIDLDCIADYKTEGLESFTISVSIPSGLLASKTVKILDSSKLPSGTLTASRAVEEGKPTVFTYSSSGLPSGINLKYKVSAVGNGGPADFLNSGSGTFTLNNGAGTITLSPLADIKTEGTESFMLAVYSDYGLLLSREFQIIDLSKASALSFDTSTTTVTEGTQITLDLTLVGVPDGSTLTYTLSGVDITASDFNPAQLSSTFYVLGAKGQIILRIANDGITEGNETVEVSVDYAGQTIKKILNLRDP